MEGEIQRLFHCTSEGKPLPLKEKHTYRTGNAIYMLRGASLPESCSRTNTSIPENRLPQPVFSSDHCTGQDSCAAGLPCKLPQPGTKMYCAPGCRFCTLPGKATLRTKSPFRQIISSIHKESAKYARSNLHVSKRKRQRMPHHHLELY